MKHYNVEILNVTNTKSTFKNCIAKLYVYAVKVPITVYHILNRKMRERLFLVGMNMLKNTLTEPRCGMKSGYKMADLEMASLLE